MERSAALEAFVQERMGQGNLAGMSLAVVKGSQLLYQRGFGMRDVEAGLPATPDTLYMIGSVTKSFACLAILQLQERGLLSVDDPVDRYLPLTLRPFGEPIRLRHLMSHTSGIPALGWAEAVLGYDQESGSPYLGIGSVEDMLTFVNGAGDWAHSRPGERWFYLNEGYAILGGVVEKVSGMPFADYVAQNILAPLGMGRSFFGRERLKAEQDAAVPYVVTPEGKRLAREYSYGQLAAAGGLISSVSDMARYLSMLLAGGSGPAGEIVSRKSLQAMMAPAVPTPPEDVLTGEPVSHYCWGLAVSDFFGRRLYGHGGSVGVATASLVFLPDEGLGAVALANGSGYPVSLFTSFALASLLGEDPWQHPALHCERVLTELAGVYEMYRGTVQVRVTRQGDFLGLQFKDRISDVTVPLVPLDLNSEPCRFTTLAGGRRLPAEFHRKAGAVELIYERAKYRRTGRA